MATVISGLNYQSIATAYGRVKYRLETASTYLFDALDTVVMLGQLEPELDLLGDFFQTYLLQSNNLLDNSPFLSPVRRLNSHIINRGGYASIDAFLLDKSNTENGSAPITIPASWADLSAAAGQTINGTYVVPDSF